ncbi:cyclin-domain-containing protein, partial [Mycotypha africana]|uniref:cyclin-domain-containing protein n=1 Tax=Mycotypha africana TaxID=64632 RepID=UPI002300A421
EQQKAYVNALVDVTVQVIASIWPNSVAVQTNGDNSTRIADLNTFLHHLLKHSRTTHSTLQLAIFYLFRIRSRILSLFHPPQNNNNNSSTDVQQDVYMTCGRRMFLAALISAHKFLQDKTYKNSAWSKVSGLNVKEINHAEKVFLQLLDYRLMVKKEVYDQWMTMLQALL